METQKPSISPLRQRMIEGMRMRKLGDRTQEGYVRAVRYVAKYLGRSPDTATVEDLHRLDARATGTGMRPDGSMRGCGHPAGSARRVGWCNAARRHLPPAGRIPAATAWSSAPGARRTIRNGGAPMLLEGSTGVGRSAPAVDAAHPDPSGPYRSVRGGRPMSSAMRSSAALASSTSE